MKHTTSVPSRNQNPEKKPQDHEHEPENIGMAGLFPQPEESQEDPDQFRVDL